MDAERARAFLLTLPHVAETLQWGDNLVFWVGDKSIGGKMFALINLSADAHGVISFAAGCEHFLELIELEPFRPAPYFARAHWVSTSDWTALRPTEWQTELRNAHAIIFAKLSKRTREQLAARKTASRPRAKAKPQGGRSAKLSASG
jgi:predicted DNA-binding protein (MmcQ/YjbR family)